MTRLIALFLAAALAAPAFAAPLPLRLNLKPVGAPQGFAEVEDLLNGGAQEDEAAPPQVQGKPVGDTLGGRPIPPELEGILTDEELEGIMALSLLIQQKHVDPVQKKQLYYGALKGMFATLDEHSEFFTPDEAKQFQGHLSGNFGGIGATMGKKEDGLPQPIVGVVPGGPAEKAGLQAGDAILEIDGQDAVALTTDKIVEKIRGPVNTPVILKVEREDPATKLKTPVTVTVTRASISLPNAFAKLLPGGKGYLYFESFRWNSAQDNSVVTVYKLLKDLKAQGAASFIIDVRNNPGGALQAAVGISSLFLKRGEKIVIMKDRQGRQRVMTAGKDGDFLGMPVKLLVNGHSASASEILAGALKDNGRGAVVGRRTYGKGSAQVVIPLPDGSAVKLTTERWYTPNGTSIDKGLNALGGVSPDVVVNVTDEEEMKAMAGVVKELMGLPAASPAAPDPALAEALK